MKVRCSTSTPLAKELGVKIANGSDPASIERHGKNAEELEAMTRRGLNSLEAIRAAATTAADLIGWPNDVGTLEVGGRVIKNELASSKP